MLAARFRGRGRIELTEVSVPEPAPDEVLVEVHSCAICGTDRRAYLHGSEITPGHEVSGRAAAAGDDVRDVEIGAPGVVYLVDYCGRCYACGMGSTNMCLRKRAMYGFTAPGGFAEFLCVRRRCFRDVAPSTPLDEATALLDLFGTARHALARGGASGARAIAVLGCGPIGLGVVAVALATTTAEVAAIDVSPYRLELAARLGARVLDARENDVVANARTRWPDGFDVVVEAAGLDATQAEAVALTAPGGRVVFVAHNRNPMSVRTLQDLIGLEKALLGSEYFPVADLEGTRALVSSGALDPRPLLTHRFPLERIEEAFTTFMDGSSGKVLVQARGARTRS